MRVALFEPSVRLYVSIIALCVVVGAAGVPAYASEPVDTTSSSAPTQWDARATAVLYDYSTPVLPLLHGLHQTALPVFVGGPLLAGGRAVYLQSQPAFAEAYRLGVSMTGAYALTQSLKLLIQRPRPYASGLVARRDAATPVTPDAQTISDRAAMPSGHATLAAALATSWSLSHPRWYVIAPATGWALGSSWSRVGLGVHYVSDVIVGLLVGGGSAVAVHLLRDTITPTLFEDTEAAAPAVHLSIPL